MTALMMGWLGTVPLAAHGIAMQLTSITFMVHLGLGNVATIRVGNAIGRNDIFHLVRGAKTLIFMSFLIAIVTVVLFVALPELLIGIFMNNGEPARAQIIIIGVNLLMMAALFQLMDGAQVVALGLLRGMQDTKMPMIIAAVSYWIIGIPCAYILGFVLGWEGVGVWLGLVVGLAFAGAALMIRFWLIAVPNLRIV
jgi:MATE family multidrug resistance protein